MTPLAAAADGVVAMKRAAFACGQCGVVAWQAPIDFLQVGAWPASLDSSHLYTIVDQALLQQYDSLRLYNPGMSMSGFLKATADAAHKARPSLVSDTRHSHRTCHCPAYCWLQCHSVPA